MNLSGLPDDTDIATGGVDLGGLPDDNARLLRQQYRATQGTPDEAAKAFDLSKRSGVPKPVVERNRAEIERIAGEPDWGALEATAPVTITQLAGNAKMFELARDDTDNMSAVEQAVRHVVGPVRSLGAGLLTDFNAAAWGLAEGTAKYAGAERLGATFETLRKGQEALGKTVQGGYGKAGLGEAGVASGFRSFGAMIPGTVAAVLTGSPQVMLATGSAQAGGQAVGKGLDKGLPPAQALLYGAEDALAEYATELIPVTRLFKDLKAGTPFLKLLGRQIATEVPTELAATAWQNFNEWANINPEKSLETYLNELGPAEAETVIATVTQTILSAGLAKGAARLNRQFEDKRQAAATAEQDAAALQEISKLAAASKLRARDPQSFEQFVGAASEDGPVQDVYLDARALQQAGVDMQALAQASPAAAAQVEEALATGGDIVIPVGEYASRVAGGDLDPVLTPHLRTSEGGLSLDEAQRFYQGMQQEMQQSAQQAMAEHEADTAWQQSAKEVETELTRQLQQTGRFTQDVNTAYATLMRDFYVATAQRLGTTPSEMFQRYPIRVAAESVAGAQRMEQGGRIFAGLTREQWLGEPKITKNANAADLKPSAIRSLDGVETSEPFLGGKYTAKFSPRGSAVFDGDRVIASYDFGDTLVVDKKYRRQGIAEELVYQWRTRYPAPAKTTTRTKASQAIQEKVWERIQREQAPNPLQRFAQGVAKALGLQQETPAPAQEPAAPGGAVLDMGQFFQGQAAVDQTETAEFKAWAEGAPVIRADETLEYQGGPAVFEGFHGTTHPDITKFRTDVGNQEGALGRGPYVSTSREDVSENYAGVGPDLTNRIEREKEQIADAFNEDDYNAEGILQDYFDANNLDIEITEDNLDDLKDEHGEDAVAHAAQNRLKGESDGLVMPLWVKFKNPFDIRPNGLDLTLEYETNEEGDIVDDSEKGTALDFIQALRSTGEAWGIDTSDLEGYVYENALDGVSAYDVWQKAQSTIYAENDPDGEPSGPGQFMQEVAREAGYDGLIQDADMHFGSGRRGFGGGRIPSMKGVEPGTLHLMPFEGKQIKSAIGNRGTFDPNDPNILKQGQGNRAEISFAKDITAAPSVITLFKNADLSSFLHEMGHFQLEVLANIASQPDAPQAIVEDFSAALEWFKPGMTLEVWNAMSLEEKRPYHEQFARGFESYLFEGKAPNAELDSLFARVRAWLTNVYKSVKALNVEISDDIRRVFDRLIATQDAIDQAEAVRSYAPLFTEAPGSMDPAAWGQYQDLASEATQNAITDMQKRSLRDMQWLGNARGRILKQLQADAKDKRKSVEAEVRAEVQAMPVYATQRFLKRGEIITETGERIQAVKGHKLDNAALAEMYPETMLARPELDGLRGMTRKEGLHPDLVAEMFGFTSGDQLVREILDAQPDAQVIEGMTDQRVLERYGDLASPDTIARAADEAIHNEARARFVATELKALTAAAGPVRAMTKAAKDFAETLIARKKLRDIKPNQHATAETRAAKAAQKALAAGDTALAATEKRNQLVQNYATRTAYNALDEIDKAVKYLRKFDGEGTRKNLDTEYLDQIDQLLERFDLRASTPLSAAKKRANLLAWVESQREQGFEPDIPPDLITEASRKPYRELTLEEMRGLVDTVKQIEHLGRLKKKLLTAKDEREFQAIRDEIAASIEANAKGVRDLRTRGTTGAMLKDAGNRFLAMHRKMASVAREMDGFQDGGPMWEYLIRSMNTAGDAETTRRAAATAMLHELLKPLLASGPMGGKGIYFEALGGSFNREERIAIALNLGNAGNMQRLLDGEGWTLERLQPLLDTITPEEADFAQGVWDFFESYRPEIAAKELRIYGKEPEWVDPVPVTLGGKTLRGGYYPVKYDTNRSGRAEQFAEAEAAKQQMRGAYTSATTRRSFTKSRAEEVSGRPLLYSFAGVYQGTNEVIHDLSWHEWLIDANRLVRSLDAPIRLHYGPETVGLFKKAIEDIAAGDVPAQNVFEKGINHLRMGATVAGLGWNFSTALLQPFGLTQSMVRVGPGWVAKGLAQWVKSPIDTGEEVQEKSAFMRDRARTMQREINEIQNQVRGAKLDPVRATFFLFIQKAQMVADMPTWLGAYEKAIAEGNAEERAVALADQAVMDAQGGGQIKDLAQIQRGGPLLKLWTNFYSFFNTTYNLAVEKTKQKGGDPKLYPSLALDYLLLFVVPSVMVTLLKAALQGGEDDEDKLVKKIIADQMSYLLGTMVGLREVTAAAQKVAGVEQFKGSYGGPAGLRMFQEIDKLATQTAQGEADTAFFKAANNAAGNLMHYPSGQINRTVEGAAALIEGKTTNPAALVFGPPKP